jgi:hypothetical protein
LHAVLRRTGKAKRAKRPKQGSFLLCNFPLALT